MEFLKQIQTKLEVEVDKHIGSELERKVKAATSNENWPATQSQLYEIASSTGDYGSYREIMPMVWKRLGESSQWRVVYKSLVLLEQLIRHGSERCIEETKDKSFTLRQLQDYHCEDDGKDKGRGVREKASEIVKLLNDTDKLRSIRSEARQNKNKYVGMSSSGYGGGGGSSGGSYDNYDNGDNYNGQSSNSRYTDNNNNNDNDYTQAPAASSSSSGSKHKSKSHREKDRDIAPVPEPVESVEAGSGSDNDDNSTKKKKSKDKKKEKKSKKDKSAVKIDGIKIAPPADFDPRGAAAPTATATAAGDDFDDDFTSFNQAQSAPAPVQKSVAAAPQYAQAAAPVNDIFDVLGPTPVKPAASVAPASLASWENFDNVTTTNSRPVQTAAFDIFGGNNNSTAVNNNNQPAFFDAFASNNNSNSTKNSNKSTTGAGFDDDFSGFSSAPAASNSAKNGKSNTAAATPKAASTATAAAAAKPKNANDLAWDTGLVNLNLGAPKPAATASGPALLGPKQMGGSGAFTGLGFEMNNRQPQYMPQQQQQQQQQQPMGMGYGFPPQQQQGFGMGMGMGMQQQQPQFGMQPQSQGFGFPQAQQPGFGMKPKQADHNIFFN